MKKCNEVMTNDPVCCLPDDTADRVALLMKYEDVGSIPIVEDLDNRHVMGIVTDRDLALQVVAASKDPSQIKIREVMRQAPFTCREDDNIEKALEAMATYQVRRIPVVDADSRIVGIISQGDVATRLDKPKKTGEIVADISK